MDQLFITLESIPLPPRFTIEDGIQQNYEMTWKDLFDHIRSRHWHSVIKKDHVTHTCPHKESLIEHLMACAEVCYHEAVERGYECPQWYYLAGLLHDIGKPGAFMIQGKRTAFKGHALIGGALLHQCWTDQLGTAFSITKEEWGYLTTAVDVHMCGYFADASEFQTDTLRLLHPCTRQLLSVLRLGDTLSLVAHEDEWEERADEKRKIVASKTEFTNMIQTDQETAVYLEKYGLNKGILIQFQGASGSGKSTLATSWKNMMINAGIPIQHVRIVERDAYMVAITRKHMGLPPLIGSVTPSIYHECYQYYVNHNKSYSSHINRCMMTDIEDALEAGYIVMTDTMATAFKEPAKSIIPVTAEHAFKVSLWCFRDKEFTAEGALLRKGFTLQNQLDATGNVHLWNPYRTMYWRDITSLTEEPKEDGYHRPHLSLSMGWNAMEYKQDATVIQQRIIEAYAYQQSIQRLPILEQTMSLHLDEVIALTYKHHGMDGIMQFFKRYDYVVTRPFIDTPLDHVVGIKYIDGKNKLWKAVWSREARGRFYWVDEHSVIPLKDTLQRGAELITKVHTDVNIVETQDIHPSQWDQFDERQQHLLRVFSKEGNTIHGYLSSKRDGSLLIISIYPPSSPQYDIMKQLVENKDVLYAESACGLIVPATQGTLFIGTPMWDYFLTALYATLGCTAPSGKDTYQHDWNAIQEPFCKWIDEQMSMMVPTISLNAMTNLSYEMICANRTTYRGTFHTELAVSYPTSSITFLGAFQDGIYYPHMMLPFTEKYVNHPFSIKVESTTDVFHILQDMNHVLLGNMTVTEFNEFYCNKTSYEFDAEGFVYLDFSDDTVDYSKIKVPLYYQCHKIKQDEIPALLKLPESVGTFFPIVSSIQHYHERLEDNIIEYVRLITQEMEKHMNSESPWYDILNEKAKGRVVSYFMTKNISDHEIIYKMMLHTGGHLLTPVFCHHAATIFEVQTDNEYASRIYVFSRRLINQLAPWRDCDIKSDVTQLIHDKNPILDELFLLVCGELYEN
jgi:energy-coupling factor transporter ATP-binding protein EcfA2